MQKELKAKKQTDTKPASGSSVLKWEYAVAVAGIIIRTAALYHQKKVTKSLKRAYE